MVARAVGLGILSEDEVPPDLRDALANGILYYRSESEAPFDDSDSKSYDSLAAQLSALGGYERHEGYG